MNRLLKDLRNLFRAGEAAAPVVPEPPAFTPERLAHSLVREGQILWAERPHEIAEAIELVERGWAIAPSPECAIQLVVMYDRANRHADSLKVLRRASRLFSDDEDVRCYATTTLFRHGSFGHLKDFSASILKCHPDNLFSAFVFELDAFFRTQVDALERRVGTGISTTKPFFLTVAMWGDAYIDDFLRYAAASLLAPGNLPGLAERRAVHFVIFTTNEGQVRLKDSPVFARLASFTQVSFHIYPATMMITRAHCEEHYGERLGEYYSRAVKFAQMSVAHYVALEVGRRVDALVATMGADNVFSDMALCRMAELIDGGNDVVLVSGFRVHKAKAVERAETHHRRPDGSLVISAEDYVDLLIENIPAEFFVDATSFADFPLMLCWRVPTEGVIVHANHYHPYCIAAGGLRHELEPTIDPVDGRFLHRHFQHARLHLVQDASIVASDWGDMPVLEQSADGTHRFSADDVGLWLWGFWDDFRAPLFRSPLRLHLGQRSQVWQRMETEAAATIEDILTATERKIDAGRSWNQ